MLGRRGPAQAAFPPQELKELGELTDVDIVVDPAALELDSASAAAVAESASRARNLELLREFAARPRRGAGRRLICHSGQANVRVLLVAGAGDTQRRAEGNLYTAAQLADGQHFKSDRLVIDMLGDAVTRFQFIDFHNVFPAARGLLMARRPLRHGQASG